MKKLFVYSALMVGCVVGFSASSYSSPLIGTYNPNDGVQLSDYLVIEGSQYLIEDKSNGSYTGASWTGTYLGTIIDIGYKANGNGGLNANESESVLEDLIGYYNGDSTFNITNYLKADSPGPAVFVDIENGITLTVTVTGANPDSGAWSITPPTYGLEFYAVKGANEFALYAVSPAMSNGFWTTAHVTNPSGTAGFSHLSGSVTTSLVPEPTTMLLFGTGLIGLAGLARRKNS